jgi:hypothetical protein
MKLQTMAVLIGIYTHNVCVCARVPAFFGRQVEEKIFTLIVNLFITFLRLKKSQVFLDNSKQGMKKSFITLTNA